jgi:hypothetical protein
MLRFIDFQLTPGGQRRFDNTTLRQAIKPADRRQNLQDYQIITKKQATKGSIDQTSYGTICINEFVIATSELETRGGLLYTLALLRCSEQEPVDRSLVVPDLLSLYGTMAPTLWSNITWLRICT